MMIVRGGILGAVFYPGQASEKETDNPHVFHAYAVELFRHRPEAFLWTEIEEVETVH